MTTVGEEAYTELYPAQHPQSDLGCSLEYSQFQLQSGRQTWESRQSTKGTTTQKSKRKRKEHEKEISMGCSCSRQPWLGFQHIHDCHTVLLQEFVQVPLPSLSIAVHG